MAVDAQGSVAEILSFNGQVKSDRRPETSRITFERGIPFFRWGGQINLAAFQSLAPKSLQSEKIISRQWPPKANPLLLLHLLPSNSPSSHRKRKNGFPPQKCSLMPWPGSRQCCDFNLLLTHLTSAVRVQIWEIINQHSVVPLLQNCPIKKSSFVYSK